jgi:putative transposase
MAYDPSIHHRRSIRLKGYDYTQPGAYFVTVIAHRRLSIFGEIAGGAMHLNACGETVRIEWMRTAAIRCEIQLDEFVVMPNHFHAIVMITECDGGSVGARRRRAPTIEQFSKPIAGSIPTVIRAYKSAVTTRINQLRGTSGAPVWQRNYHEHIIRNADELSRIREYIRYNPMAWETDDEYPHQH